VETEIFQTVESTPNKDKLLQEAPFRCEDDPHKLKEWLGSGYYFWDTFIELAHWWGRVHYKNKKHTHYAICKTVLKCNDDDILDLVGNLGQVQDVREIYRQLRNCEQYKSKEFKAQTIINYIRNTLGVQYKAIRAYGEHSSRDPEITKHRLKFSDKAYLNLCPEVQICVFDKSSLNLPMKLVYCSEQDSVDSFTI
jgi:uncharacterized protein YlbG (UPF0298 family)